MNKFIYSYNDLADLVEEYGFLPLFKNQIEGFSVEEHTPPELWFAENADGPWEWKGPVIQKQAVPTESFSEEKPGL
ncbi:MAG: hypothetical protein LIO44_00420 [Eubacterium sp.]|nr:hypothetical protein [Eubacterium sp.]